MEPGPEYDDRYLATIYGGICSQTKRSLNCVLNDVNVMARAYLSWFESAFNQSATPPPAVDANRQGDQSRIDRRPPHALAQRDRSAFTFH
jgi:hypothetical protein